MSKWLVIGASSFSGSHFCRHLKAKGDIVYAGSLREFMSGDTLEPFDYIANFAALNVVAPSWQQAEQYMQINVVRQIELWQHMQCKVYLHVSTPEVYGSTNGWITEDAPYNPSTPYAVSRAAAEMMLKCYHRQYGLPVVFTRACNVYGPGQQLYRLIPKLIHCIKSGKRFPLEGGGFSARAFLHIDDVCEAYYLAATKGEPGEAYHVSSRDYQSIRGIVMLVCNAMKVDPADVIEEALERPGKDASYSLNWNKLAKLGWQQRVSLPEGIRSVVEYMNANWETLKDQPTNYEFKP